MTTPARIQYLRIKAEHPDDILLFRMGDFYETFDHDAEVVARDLEIALTSREFGKGQRVPLAGIPYHALDTYLAKLIEAGHRVALCEQTSDPATSKGLVDREVVRVVTPGTVVEDSILDPHSNSYLAAIFVHEEEVGLAYADITTSEFSTGQFSIETLRDEIARLGPAEVIVPDTKDGLAIDLGKHRTVSLPLSEFGLEATSDVLKRHFGVQTLESFGCERLPLATRAAGALVTYLSRSHQAGLAQLTGLSTYSAGAYMVLDPETIRNLELFEGGRWNVPEASLTSVLDDTRTAMGARMLRRWISKPLLDLETLEARLDAVQWFHSSAVKRGNIAKLLASMSDIERLVNKVRGASATPQDLIALKKSLLLGPQIRDLMSEGEHSDQVSGMASQIGDHSEVVGLIEDAITDDPARIVGEGRVIRKGYSSELDGMRAGAKSARDYIAGLEVEERTRTGIKTLKVGFNKVFGYYIEVSKANAGRVPGDYIRRQTLVNAERYVTGDMKMYESKVLAAQDLIAELEVTLFRNVCGKVAEATDGILRTGRTIARVDAVRSLAEVAATGNYVRPELGEEIELNIEQGWHPVVRQMLPTGRFVPNDARLSSLDEQLVILTGPNMAGKSTFIRQIALIVLMAQIGSFVPARSASIGLVDRIFTRVGLQDDLTVGQSTFMVEMVETAAILNQATQRSLIVLDEIGRGTSTYDGLAIARATAEYIHNHPGLGCRTLFATHYHELTELAESLPRVRNYNVLVAEDDGEVVFLHRIVPGGADRSYGVHVAKLAGLPAGLIQRAWEILSELEKFPPSGDSLTESPVRNQLSLFDSRSPALEELSRIDPMLLSPLQAITKLFELKDMASE